MEFESEIVSLRNEIRTRESKHAEARAAADKMRDEMRAEGVNIAGDKDAFEKIDAAYRDADALRDEIADLRQREHRLMEIAGEKIVTRDEVHAVEPLTNRFLNSEVYAGLRDRLRTMEGARVETAPVEVATRDEFAEGIRLRTLVDSSSGSGGGLIWSDRRENLLVPVPVRRIRLLDVMTVETTDSDTIEYVKETTLTDAAAETDYGTAAPESAYGYTKQSTTVKRVSHFVPATKGALMDGGRLRTLLEGRLVRGVNLRIEGQSISGDGTGDNLTGLYNVSGVNTVALGSDTRFDAVHKAVTAVRTTFFEEPSAIGIHPSDYEQVVLEKDSAGNYVHGRAAAESATATIWGLTPVVSTVFASGTPVVGDFSGLVLAVRSGVAVSASDSHSDYFLKGLVALLAEARVAVYVPQPLAFCTITGF